MFTVVLVSVRLSVWSGALFHSVGDTSGLKSIIKQYSNSSLLSYLNKECLATSWYCYSSSLTQIENSVIAKCYNCKNIPEDLHHVSG